MGRFNYDSRPLRPSGFGLVVDSSRATDTYPLRGESVMDIIRENRKRRKKIPELDNTRLDKLFILFIFAIYLGLGLLITFF